VPVHDLAIQERENDLVVGTHGRGAFILDDLTPLEQLTRAKSATVAHLFPVRDATLVLPDGSRNSGMGSSGYTGQNPAAGAMIAYLVSAVAPGDSARLEVVDGAGTVVRQLAFNRQPGLYRQVWDMRVGAPLTGPVVAAPAGRAGGGGGVGGGGGGGGGGGFGRGGGGGEITFVAMPGAYRARLTITPGSGSALAMEQPFMLTRDAAVILTDAELRQLHTTRLTIARLQAGLRETQAKLDTVQRQLGEARRAADSSSATPAATKEQLAALEKSRRSPRSLANAGRGGAGGAGRGDVREAQVPAEVEERRMKSSKVHRPRLRRRRSRRG
jgi:hypothetical protein